MTYLFLLLPFALAPSLIWLVFYLRKDSHPEPNFMIVKIFLGGMLVTIPAIYIEQFFHGFFSGFPVSTGIFLLLHFFIGIAMVEELLKYLVVRVGALSSKELDEPLDIVLYMVISGLGFAALENIFLLSKLSDMGMYRVSDIFLINLFRFFQAILLHALVSGLLGYFIALSFRHKKGKNILLFAGFAVATFLHGIFNLYIYTLGDRGIEYLLLPVGILLLIACYLSYVFRILKLKKSTCDT